MNTATPIQQFPARPFDLFRLRRCERIDGRLQVGELATFDEREEFAPDEFTGPTILERWGSGWYMGELYELDADRKRKACGRTGTFQVTEQGELIRQVLGGRKPVPPMIADPHIVGRAPSSAHQNYQQAAPQQHQHFGPVPPFSPSPQNETGPVQWWQYAEQKAAGERDRTRADMELLLERQRADSDSQLKMVVEMYKFQLGMMEAASKEARGQTSLKNELREMMDELKEDLREEFGGKDSPPSGEYPSGDAHPQVQAAMLYTSTAKELVPPLLQAVSSFLTNGKATSGKPG